MKILYTGERTIRAYGREMKTGAALDFTDAQAEHLLRNVEFKEVASPAPIEILKEIIQAVKDAPTNPIQKKAKRR